MTGISAESTIEESKEVVRVMRKRGSVNTENPNGFAGTQSTGSASREHRVPGALCGNTEDLERFANTEGTGDLGFASLRPRVDSDAAGRTDRAGSALTPLLCALCALRALFICITYSASWQDSSEMHTW